MQLCTVVVNLCQCNSLSVLLYRLNVNFLVLENIPFLFFSLISRSAHKNTLCIYTNTKMLESETSFSPAASTFLHHEFEKQYFKTVWLYT